MFVNLTLEIFISSSVHVQEHVKLRCGISSPTKTPSGNNALRAIHRGTVTAFRSKLKGNVYKKY